MSAGRVVFDAWRTDQGARIKAHRPVAVYRHCESLARQLAPMERGRLILSMKQIRLCEHRAISAQRLSEFGPPTADVDAWWDQISSIAARWGIATKREDWAVTTPERKEAA